MSRCARNFVTTSSTKRKSGASRWATVFRVVFENRDTVIFQIQEMLRAERITDLDKIREEIAVYNELVPDTDELSATLFLEIEDQSHLREDLLEISWASTKRSF